MLAHLLPSDKQREGFRMPPCAALHFYSLTLGFIFSITESVVAEVKLSGTLKSQATWTGFLIRMVCAFLFCPIPTNKGFKPNSAAYGRNSSHVMYCRLWYPGGRQILVSFLYLFVSCLPLKRETAYWKVWFGATYTLHYICFSLLEHYATLLLLFPYSLHKLFVPVLHVGKQMVEAVSNWLPRSCEIELSQEAPPGTLYLLVCVSKSSC